MTLTTIRSARAFIAATAFCVCASASSAASPDFAFKLLDTIDGKPAAASSINNAGQIVGGVQKGGYEFYGIYIPQPVYVTWTPDGTIHELAAGGGATGINASGQVSGTYNPLGKIPSDSQATLTTNGNTITLELSAAALGLNDAGMVAGSRYADGITEAVVWSGSTATTLPSLGGNYSVAHGINNAGTAVGVYNSTDSCVSSVCHRPVMWANGTVTELNAFGRSEGWAAAINDSGVIVGSSTDAAGQARAIRWENGQFVDLGLGSATSVNESGQIVGVHGRSAMLWHDGLAINLNSFLPADSEWRLETASGINDLGAIVGTAYHATTGAARGFVLTPVPEPGSMMLMLLGLTALTALARHRRAA